MYMKNNCVLADKYPQGLTLAKDEYPLRLGGFIKMVKTVKQLKW